MRYITDAAAPYALIFSPYRDLIIFPPLFSLFILPAAIGDAALPQ